eukprot:COSAG01_NODE_9001_length_2586_cov_8.895858_5_plen_172_part_01
MSCASLLVPAAGETLTCNSLTGTAGAASIRAIAVCISCSGGIWITVPSAIFDLMPMVCLFVSRVGRRLGSAPAVFWSTAIGRCVAPPTPPSYRSPAPPTLPASGAARPKVGPVRNQRPETTTRSHAQSLIDQWRRRGGDACGPAAATAATAAAAASVCVCVCARAHPLCIII